MTGSAPAHPSEPYIIEGGQGGRARLAVLSRVLAASTGALLDRFGPLEGRTVVDAGCGGGDVSFELARRVGPQGRVIGLDMDEQKLAIARAEAAGRGLRNVTFVCASVLDPWPVQGAALAHARFLLTHTPEPQAVLARALAALAEDGAIAVQDIDYAGQFCDPPSAAFERAGELYVRAAEEAGGDPFIGRRLVRLLEDAGFRSVDGALTQPFGRSGDVVEIPCLTFEAIAAAVIRAGLATADQTADIARDLRAFAARPETTLSLPRIFQAWGRDSPR
jgi:SAM-dependent methyltransferase